MGNQLRSVYYRYQRIKVERIQRREQQEDAAFNEMKQTKKQQVKVLKEQKDIIQRKLDNVQAKIDAIVTDPRLDDQAKIYKLGGYANAKKSYEQELQSIELSIIQCKTTLGTIRAYRRSVQNQRTNKRFVEISSRVPHLDLDKRVREMERTNDDAQDVIDRLRDINEGSEADRVDPFEIESDAKDILEKRKKHLGSLKATEVFEKKQTVAVIPDNNPAVKEEKKKPRPSIQPLLPPPPPPSKQRNQTAAATTTTVSSRNITDEDLDSDFSTRRPTNIKAAASSARAVTVVPPIIKPKMATAVVVKKTVNIAIGGECDALAKPKTLITEDSDINAATSVRLLA
jgi:hypothetical protein